MIESLPRIAVVEDNEDLREELLFYLNHKGFPAWGTGSAESFWKLLHRQDVDIVLVDLGLPGEDGFSIVQFLHELQGYGSIVITARGDQQDRLRGLNLGADLFLVKPINFAQLADALVQLNRRLKHGATTESRAAEPGWQGWSLSPSGERLLGPGGKALPLSRQESALLSILLTSTNQVFTRQALHDLMFEHAAEPDLHRIDVILSRLRQKARREDVLIPIRTIFGRGIVFAGSAG
ncbi:response regulator transcription factor [Salinicola lusitanus]|uniref:Response regulator transcription factor n=1 Tax=Salinicola lusitanus TaxID=1949085 RepID=A0ABZ3CZA5_9GAMM